MSETRPVAHCPGCGATLPANPALGALSRFDNTTRICSDCGTKEGLAQFAAASRGEDPRRVLAGPGRLRGEEIV
jgi:hypothetical protein